MCSYVDILLLCLITHFMLDILYVTNFKEILSEILKKLCYLKDEILNF